MKIYQLNKGDIILYEDKNKKIYLRYDGCDGGYGKFIEVNINGRDASEPVYDQVSGYIYFACFTSLEELNLKLFKRNKKGIFNEAKELLSSWFKSKDN